MIKAPAFRGSRLSRVFHPVFAGLIGCFCEGSSKRAPKALLEALSFSLIWQASQGFSRKGQGLRVREGVFRVEGRGLWVQGEGLWESY